MSYRNIQKIADLITEIHGDLDLDVYPIVRYLESQTSRSRMRFSHCGWYTVLLDLIDQIYENSPKTILDVGCGDNFLQEFFPEMIGLDQSDSADIKGFMDPKFAHDNSEKYDSLIALNSLHFGGFRKCLLNVNSAIKVVRSKGRLAFAFNMMMLCNNNNSLLEGSFGSLLERVNDFIRAIEERDDLTLIFQEITPLLVIERTGRDLEVEKKSTVNDLRRLNILGNGINGDIRLVVEKK